MSWCFIVWLIIERISTQGFRLRGIGSSAQQASRTQLGVPRILSYYTAPGFCIHPNWYLFCRRSRQTNRTSIILDPNIHSVCTRRWSHNSNFTLHRDNSLDGEEIRDCVDEIYDFGAITNKLLPCYTVHHGWIFSNCASTATTSQLFETFRYFRDIATHSNGTHCFGSTFRRPPSRKHQVAISYDTAGESNTQW